MNQHAKHIIHNQLEALKQRIAHNITSTGRNASGKTITSLHIEEYDTGAKLLGRPFFGTLETGRRPGKIPYNLSSIILQWIKDKSITLPAGYRDEHSFARAIAFKIKKEGTALYRKKGDNEIYSKEIPATIQALHKQLAGIYKQEIQNIKLN
jgi:hypothetical protein